MNDHEQMLKRREEYLNREFFTLTAEFTRSDIEVLVDQLDRSDVKYDMGEYLCRGLLGALLSKEKTYKIGGPKTGDRGKDLYKEGVTMISREKFLERFNV